MHIFIKRQFALQMIVSIATLSVWIHLTQTHEGRRIMDYVLHQDLILQMSKPDLHQQSSKTDKLFKTFRVAVGSKSNLSTFQVASLSIILLGNGGRRARKSFLSVVLKSTGIMLEIRGLSRCNFKKMRFMSKRL